MKISIIAAALALDVPAAAYAAADCCESTNCYEGGEGGCCKGMGRGGDQAGHDMHGDRARVQPA